MKKVNVLGVCVIVGIGILLQSAHAQYREYAKESGIGIPFFKLALNQRFDEHSKQVHFYTRAQFLYDDLMFVRSDTSGYDADLEFIIAIYDKNNRVVRSKTVHKKIHVPNFDLTNSRKEKLIIKNDFFLNPGKYKILGRSNDLISNKSAQRKVSIKIDDFIHKKIAMSKIIFAHDLQRDSSGHVLSFTPTFGNNFNVRSGHFFVLFDVFTQDTLQPLQVHYSMSSKSKKSDLDTTITRTAPARYNTFVLDIRKERFNRSEYTLEVTVSSGKNKIKQLQNFSFYWTDVPNTIADIDLALKEMTYILSSDSLKKYLKAPLKEKQAFFKRFWKERDPDPATARNELKNEYFKRVNYANREFKVMGQQGWQTDRGRILIKFGFPDDVERHPFEMGTKPYVIWRYYNLRKTFLFIDVTGFGDYRLHPDFLEVEYQ